jgi:kynurenine formamidase
VGTVEGRQPVDSTRPARALQRIGPQEVLAAIGLVKSGRVYDLGLDLNSSVPQGLPGAFDPFSFRWTHLPEDGREGLFQFAAESVGGTPHIGTHIDGLMHVSSGTTMFGGGELADVCGENGFTRDGIDTVVPIVTRAVVVDMAHRLGDPLPDRYEVTIRDIQGTLFGQHSRLKTGDAILVRTGKVRQYGVDNDAYQQAQPGVGPDAAIWLYEQGMAVLGTDTTGTEPVPFPDPSRTTHQAMLVERGVHLLENLNLEELGRDNITEAMFVCLPLRLTGATGSWVRPIAIV